MSEALLDFLNQDPSLLREYSQEKEILTAQLSQLNQELIKATQQAQLQSDGQAKLIEQLTLQIEELQRKVDWFAEQFRLSRQQLYGAKSEKNIPELPLLFNEPEAVAEAEPAPSQEVTFTVTRKQKGVRRIPDNATVETVEHKLPEEEQICSICGGPLHEMGCDRRNEIHVTPAQGKIVTHLSYKYSCRDCDKHGTEVEIKKAEAPKPLMENSPASASSVAFVMINKYEHGLPLYRQEKIFERMGLAVSRSMMSNWVVKGAELLEPIERMLREKLVERGVLHADETPVQVLHEDGRAAQTKSYMWMYRTAEEQRQVVIFDYQTTRERCHPQEFLKEFRGYLHVDGYVGYEGLEGVKLSGCWAHARRKYADALKGMSRAVRTASRAGEAVEMINQLFRIEREIKDRSPGERLEERRNRSGPVLEKYRNWLEEMSEVAAPKSLLGQAIGYSIGQWKKLVVFMEDGRLEISNNRAERSIKPFVMGRRAWLFSNTPRGARASALIYSIVETAKENGVDAYAYLSHVFEKLPNMDTSNREEVEQLLPWNVKL